MIFHIFWTIKTESVQRFSLYKPIDKVGSFYRPALRNLNSLDLNLLSKNMLSDFLPIPSSVWPSSKHAFVANNAHSKIIYSNSMRLLAHYLRSHVSWGSRGILRVIWVPYSSNTQVSDLQITIFVENQVFRFYVSMKNTFLMQIFERQQHTSNEKSSLLLCEFLMFSQMISEITSLHHVYDEIEVLSILKGIVHVNQEPINV